MNFLSPLELKQPNLERLDIRVAPDWQPSETTAEDYRISVDVDVSAEEAKNTFGIVVGFRLLPNKDCPCRFQRLEVRLSGLFVLPPDTDEKLVKTLVPLNCFAILYGVARGVVMQATGMVKGGPLLLPAVNFHQVWEQHQKRKAKLAKQPATA